MYLFIRHTLGPDDGTGVPHKPLHEPTQSLQETLICCPEQLGGPLCAEWTEIAPRYCLSNWNYWVFSTLKYHSNLSQACTTSYRTVAADLRIGLRFFLKVYKDSEFLVSCGREFHSLGAEQEKAPL